MALAERHARERIAAERIWWIGGYALGLALPPSWVGHAYLANDGPERIALEDGWTSNFETILYDRERGLRGGRDRHRRDGRRRAGAAVGDPAHAAARGEQVAA